MAGELKCIVCQEKYNARKRAPVVLPACGHTFCRSCLMAMQCNSSPFKCPTCRCFHAGTPIEDLPNNYALMNLILDEGDEEEEATNNKDTRESNNSNEFVGSNPSKQESKCPNQPGNNGGIGKKILIGTCAGVGAVGVVAAAPFVLAGVGFTSGGIAAGSYAASMMSSAAIANGGGVAAGGLVATLQSVGAAGLGATGSAVLGSVGGALGTGVGFLSSKLFGRKKDESDGDGKKDESDGDGSSGTGKDKTKSEKQKKYNSSRNGNTDKGDSSENECDKDDSEGESDKDDSGGESDKGDE